MFPWASTCVFTQDNSGTKKQGVSRTYAGIDGFAPIAAYLAQEGWLLEIEHREGSQHGQKNFIHLWHRRAFAEGTSSEPSPGKRIALLSVHDTHTWTDESGVKQELSCCRVVCVIEHTIDRKGQLLLEPDIELEGWWTTLALPAEKIIALYQDHSELKTDMDLERLPSGKFAVNSLVMSCAALAYNILRFIRQLGLLGDKTPVRHPAKRRRIKTVIQELMYLAARLIETGRRIRLRFSRHSGLSFEAFAGLYQRLAYG